MNAHRRFVLPITLVLGLLTVVLGSIGYREALDGTTAGDAFYRGLGLLGQEYGGPDRPPWELEVGRFLGVLTLGFALLALLASLARERADRLRIRTLAHGHDVVIGSGERGLSLAVALEEEGRGVVLVEADEQGRKRARSRSRRLSVIVGNPHDRDVYANSAVTRAKNVFIATGDDSRNLQALEVCLGVAGERGPAIHVEVDGYLLWRELHRSALTWTGSGAAIEFISLPDRVAVRIVEGAAEMLSGSTFALWGSGPKAVRVAAHAVRWILLNGGEPELVLAGPGSEALERRINDDEPWIPNCARITQIGGPGTGPVGVAFVVGIDYADTLAGASALADELPNASVVAEVRLAVGSEALSRSGFPTDRVQLVEAESDVLGSGLIGGSVGELIARAKHADYVVRDLNRGITPEENPSLVPWEELPESLRESNRLFAESVGERLVDMGADLEPLAGPMPEMDLVFGEKQVEALAEVEHERWVNDLERNGWKLTDGDKDPKLKLHPLMVPWGALSEAEKEKDMDAIRVLPKALARVGYKLRIPR